MKDGVGLPLFFSRAARRLGIAKLKRTATRRFEAADDSLGSECYAGDTP
jgi:hypothetical protein